MEVKGPGWESELRPEERARGRQQMGKNVDLEVRAVDSIRPMLYAIDKSVPKFVHERCNLVAIVDDLFISPTGLPSDWLEAAVQSHLQTKEHQTVGGVFLLKPELSSGPIDDLYRFVPNLKAARPLPAVVLEGWIASNSNCQGPPSADPSSIPCD